MPRTKKWYESKTVIASLVTATIIITGFFDQRLSERVAEEQGILAETIMAGVALVSTATAIYGRITAKEEISSD